MNMVLQKPSSPSIVKTFGYGVYQDAPALWLENITYPPLTKLIRSFTLEEKLRVAIEIASALAEIHHSNVVHKDIKPQNILVDPETLNIKIIDFGISTELTREIQEIINPKLIGTINYISPEQTGRTNSPLDYTEYLFLRGCFI